MAVRVKPILLYSLLLHFQDTVYQGFPLAGFTVNWTLSFVKFLWENAFFQKFKKSMLQCGALILSMMILLCACISCQD